MANRILTPDMITREAIRLLHQKCNFLGTVNRQYDSSFAQNGAKIGSSLRIRKPARYTVRSGAALSVQDHVEENLTLTVDKQLGVDTSFSSEELTMDLDDFSTRVLEPKMADLASAIEEALLAKAQTAVGTVIDGVTFKDFNLARAYLTNQACPQDNMRTALVDPLTSADLVDSLKGLSQDSTSVAKQYKEGILARTAGFDWYENSRIPTVTLPADIAGWAVTSIGAADAVTGLSNTIAIDGATAGQVIAAGTAFTVAGVNAIHPQTKKTYSYAYTFVVQSDVTVGVGGVATLTVHPFGAVAAAGARANVSAAPGAADAITVLGGVGGAVVAQNLAYHKDFFTVAFADLILPKGTDMASRQQYDGISMRMIRDYDISTDVFAVRFDVLFGSQGLRPEYGAKLLS